MDLRPWILPGLLGLAALALYGLDRLGRRLNRRGWIDTRPRAARRGVGHAMLGLQGFVEPRAEHVFAAQNLEQKDVEDEVGAGDAAEIQTELILADLSESLGFTPVDPEEVRRHLSAARRAGLDWRALYDQAVRAELAARPYRAPSLPPVGRVAPRE
jgi:hypothetical protein